MRNAELIKELSEAFDLITPASNARELSGIIRGIVRAINRITVEKRDTALHLKKTAMDIQSAYASQCEYSELKNKQENPGLHVKPEFDQSFFDSISILRAGLFKLLEGL